MHINITMTAGQRLEFYERGDFFRLMEATAPLTVDYYLNSKELAEAANVGVGYAERFMDEGFDKIAITSSADQTISFATRLGNEVWYDTPPNGQVTVTNTSGVFTTNQRTITTTPATIFSNSTARRYLLIQNNDTNGIVYVRFGGALGSFSVASSIQIPPGGSLELQGFVHSGSIHMAGSIASNANVVTVEG